MDGGLNTLTLYRPRNPAKPQPLTIRNNPSARACACCYCARVHLKPDNGRTRTYEPCYFFGRASWRRVLVGWFHSRTLQLGPEALQAYGRLPAPLVRSSDRLASVGILASNRDCLPRVGGLTDGRTSLAAAAPDCEPMRSNVAEYNRQSSARCDIAGIASCDRRDVSGAVLTMRRMGLPELWEAVCTIAVCAVLCEVSST